MQPNDDTTPLIDPTPGRIAIALSMQDSQAEQIAAEREQLLARVAAARAEAETARQHLYDLFMQAPAFICILRGPEHVVELINEPFCQLLGGRDFLGKTARAGWPELADQGFIALLDRVYATGEPFVATELYIQIDRNNDGILEDGYFSFTYQPARGTDGQVSGILVHGVEVTDQVLARQAIQHSEELYHATFDQAPVGIAHMLPDGGFGRVNQRFCDIVGYTPEELRVRTFRDITHPDDVADDLAAIERFRTIDPSQQTRQKRYIHKDGHVVWVNLTVSVVRDAVGRMRHSISIVEDITERLLLGREREQMLHIVSHELRTPLTSLQMRVQLAERRLTKTAHPEAELAQKAAEDIRRLVRLVEDLNEGAQLERGKFSLNVAPCDLNALCREIAAEQQSVSGRTVALDLPKRAVVAQADAQRIRQVITNLLNNAVKYTPADASVTLQLRHEGQFARLAVVDTGPGIPAEALPHVFERFYRAPGAEMLRGSHVGLGLGLFIARALVEAHGGEMGVASAIAAGTTFWFTLPLTQEAGNGLTP